MAPLLDISTVSRTRLYLFQVKLLRHARWLRPIDVDGRERLALGDLDQALARQFEQGEEVHHQAGSDP